MRARIRDDIVFAIRSNAYADLFWTADTQATATHSDPVILEVWS